MKKERKCKDCGNKLSIEGIYDASWQKNKSGRFCLSCIKKREETSRIAATADEENKRRKLKIVYGQYWEHYAQPQDFNWSLSNERDYCPYCGVKFSDVAPSGFSQSQYHVDHMDPLSKGGENSIRNAVVCCGPCNIKKGRQLFKNWLKKLEPKYLKLAKEIYVTKHNRDPEEFEKSYPSERYGESSIYLLHSEYELNEMFPEPIAKGPPSNEPIVIKFNIMEAIENLPGDLKEKLKIKN